MRTSSVELSNIPVEKWKGSVLVSIDIPLWGLGLLRKTVGYAGDEAFVRRQHFMQTLMEK